MIRNRLRPNHLRDPWRDSFVLELRLRNVTGSRIGDMLAQVDAHGADSGEEPEQAFGDPVDYAAHVAEEVPPADLIADVSPRRVGQIAITMLLGVQTLLAGVAGLGHGGPAVFSVGSLVGILLGTAGVILLFRFASVLLSQRHRVLGFVALWLIWGAMIAPQIIWKSSALEFAAWLSMAAAVVLLVATWVLVRGDQTEAVVNPLTGRDSIQPPRWVGLVKRWSMPILLAGLILLILLTPVH